MLFPCSCLMGMTRSHLRFNSGPQGKEVSESDQALTSEISLVSTTAPVRKVFSLGFCW